MPASVTVLPESAQWATSGTNNTDAPSGNKASGWIPGEKPPAQWLNYWQNLIGGNNLGPGVGDVAWIPYLTLGLRGLLQWSGYLWSVGGTPTAPAVTVDAIDCLVTDAGIVTGAPAFTFTDLSLLESHAGSLSANTPYYLYASIQAGALAYRISATAPESTAGVSGTPTWEGGQVGIWRYLGCFITDSLGNPIPFRAVRGRYFFRVSATSALGPVGGSAYTSTSWSAAISLAQWMPLHARVAQVALHVTDTGGAGLTSGSIRTNGDTTNAISCDLWASGTGATAVLITEIEPDSSHQINLHVGQATTSLSAYIYGFAE